MKKQSAVPLVLVTLFVVSVAWGFDDPPKTPAGIVIESRDGKPLITEKDILKYDGTTHTITLVPGLRATLQEQLRASLVGGYSVRIVVDKRVAYEGLITTGLSSQSFKVPVIVIDKCIQDETLGEDQIRIELGYPTPRFFQGDDPRSNPLLKRSLQKAEKLRPVAPEARHIKTEQIVLSLHQREEKGRVVLDILVSNVSTAPIEIVSKGMAPPWSVWAWFKWEIDGEPAEYSENVAGIPDMRELWLVPPNGTILWASIPLWSLKHVVSNESGQRELRSVIQDTNRHIVTIRPSDRWKDMTVGAGKIEIGKKDTEPKDAPDKE